MKQWKKGMAVLLAFAMVIIGLNISPGSARAADAPRFFAEAVTAEPGSEIEIPVKIDGNTGIMGLGITFGFDKQVLTPVDDVKQTSLLVGQVYDSVQGTLKDGTDTFDVIWPGTDNMNEDGELFTLKFKVADNASGSTKVTLTLREDDTYYGVGEDMINKAVDCEDITVTIKDAEPTQAPEPTDEPTQAPKPTREPDETETPYATKEPYDPTWTEAPEGTTAEVYLDYHSDKEIDGKEMIDGLIDGVYANITGNGEYSIEFLAAQSTKDINLLRLSTWLGREDLPAGMRIVPTMLTVGDATYPLTQWQEDEYAGYMVIIRDMFEDFDGGYEQIPVSAGDTVKVTFKIEGIGSGTGDDPTPPPSSTEQPAAPTNAPGGQQPSAPAPNVPGTGTTNVPGAQNPAGNNPPSAVTPAFSLPGKVSLKSVKKAGKKKLKVVWKWSSGMNGFQIQCAQNRGFTKKKKTVSVGFWQSKKTVSKLASKKTYYVRVRAYKYNNGRKYYGPWSNVKKCKVK